jgi:hypothetical protein
MEARAALSLAVGLLPAGNLGHAVHTALRLVVPTPAGPEAVVDHDVYAPFAG